MTNIKIFVFRY